MTSNDYFHPVGRLSAGIPAPLPAAIISAHLEHRLAVIILQSQDGGLTSGCLLGGSYHPHPRRVSGGMAGPGQLGTGASAAVHLGLIMRLCPVRWGTGALFFLPARYWSATVAHSFVILPVSVCNHECT